MSTKGGRFPKKKPKSCQRSLWTIPYIVLQFDPNERTYQRFITVECKSGKQMVQTVSLFYSPILKLERLDAILFERLLCKCNFHCIRLLTNNKELNHQLFFCSKIKLKSWQVRNLIKFVEIQFAYILSILCIFRQIMKPNTIWRFFLHAL